jgi:hypothetical protein
VTATHLQAHSRLAPNSHSAAEDNDWNMLQLLQQPNQPASLLRVLQQPSQ